MLVSSADLMDVDVAGKVESELWADHRAGQRRVGLARLRSGLSALEKSIACTCHNHKYLTVSVSSIHNGNLPG